MDTKEDIIGLEFFNWVNDQYGNHTKIPENISDIFVLWSGGCDSTALVLYLWEKFHKTINLVSIHYDRFGSYPVDIIAQKRLLKVFKERKMSVNHITFEIKENCDYDDYCNNGGIVQPQLFLSMMANLIRGNNRLISFGYIKNDDIWHFMDKFNNLFETINSMSNANASLYLPFEWIEKKYILWYLHEHKVLKYCSYCQYPGCVDKKPCNNCSSCNLHNSALEYCKKKKWEFFAL